MSASTTERLLNLVIALLGSRYGRTRDFLRTRIHGYDPAASDEAFGRMFERDKVHLKRLGIPIIAERETATEDENQWKYRIRPQDYRLPEIPLDAEGAAVLSLAARVWEQASLGSAAARALRKLETVTGLEADDGGPVEARISTREPAFDPLWDALLNHHPVSFAYRNAQQTETAVRQVEPWGLGNKYGQWYLSGEDRERGEERLFRLSRMVGDVTVRTGSNFAPPADYDIGAALDRLGTGPLSEAVLEVPGGRAQLLRDTATVVGPAGRPGWDRLTVPYREPEMLADDLASLGAAAVVVSPEALRQEVLRRLDGAREATGRPVPEADFGIRMPRHRPQMTAEDRLRRLLDLVPFLVRNPGIEAAAVAREFDISRRQLEDDFALLTVCGLPGYLHGDLIDISWDEGVVFIRDAEELARPLRLTQEEAAALLVGLESLHSLPDAAGRAALDAVLTDVRKVAGDDAWVADVVEARIAPEASLETLALLQRAVTDRTCVRIRYFVRQRDEANERVIEPLRLFSQDSTWYVEAWCRTAEGLRNFRLDNIRAAAATEEAALDRGLPRNGWLPASPFMPGAADLDVVLALDARASWVADAYGAEAQAPLPDGRIAVRIRVGRELLVPELVARLGGGGQLLEPARLRALTSDWLDAALANYAAAPR